MLRSFIQVSSMKLNDSYMNLNYDICHSSFHNYKGLTVRKWKYKFRMWKYKFHIWN